MTKIERTSLLSLEEYAKQRPEIRTEAMRLKRIRSVFVGPNMTLQFETKQPFAIRFRKCFALKKRLKKRESWMSLKPTIH
jgi:hypothetical protein